MNENSQKYWVVMSESRSGAGMHSERVGLAAGLDLSCLFQP